MFPFVQRIEEALVQSSNPKPTAMAFLSFLKRIRSVILQDAAVMMQNGREHHLFSLPVFQTDLFRTFQSQLIQQLATDVDPVDTSMERVLPGISSRLSNIHVDISKLQSSIHHVDEQMDNLGNAMNSSNAQVSHFLSYMQSYERLPDQDTFGTQESE